MKKKKIRTTNHQIDDLHHLYRLTLFSVLRLYFMCFFLKINYMYFSLKKPALNNISLLFYTIFFSFQKKNVSSQIKYKKKYNWKIDIIFCKFYKQPVTISRK
ncbi:hypothetical protein PPACK8108_LOCUS14374 [Phakopsora pachyrhizi]|uniref:Uncharacterized protein n=1 Tax=Phakopsora pachyrhizi TaxID=170000 RepID=A0AAV0B8J7_PHAPC|nr:hypothetical protein PPACK8108_LOCUS14374 [Phakopsora pachyrhizi]